MLKRIFVLLLMLAVLLPALAEENALPVVINRVDDLEAHSDFVFAEDAALLQITNPAAKTDRELVVFRDSFASSLIPLLIKDYATVTVVGERNDPPQVKKC